jgi:hypothetical protein
MAVLFSVCLNLSCQHWQFIGNQRGMCGGLSTHIPTYDQVDQVGQHKQL